MINFPNKNELEELTNFNSPFCLTIYSPFIDPNGGTNPNRIEFKNLLQEAKATLLSAGANLKEVEMTLKPALGLLSDREFWPIQHEGLVLFMHHKLFLYYHMPDNEMQYKITVGKGFDLEPLLKIMNKNKSYFVLSLGHKDVQFYEGDNYGLKQIHLKGFPTDMEGTLNIDENPNWTEGHPIGALSSGKVVEALHGQYEASQADKEMLLQFFRQINKHLNIFLKNKQAPLILAGVNYIIPIYNQVNTYPHILTESITGSLIHTKLDKIRLKALGIVNS